MEKVKRREKGFTLIELLIVVAIIAILAAIAIPNFLQAQIRAKVSRTLAEFQTLDTALESYYVDNNAYPDTRDYPPLTTPISYITSWPASAWNEEWFYFAPSTDFEVMNRTYLYVSTDPWGTYAYDGQLGQGFISGDYIDYVGFLMGVNINQFDPQSIRWELKSCGPGGIDDVNAEMHPGDYAGLPPNFTAYLYDPTNGTVSPGNIVWFNNGTGSGRAM